MSRRKSNLIEKTFTEMFLVPKDIYIKFIETINTCEKKCLTDLNGQSPANYGERNLSSRVANNPNIVITNKLPDTSFKPATELSTVKLPESNFIQAPQKIIEDKNDAPLIQSNNENYAKDTYTISENPVDYESLIESGNLINDSANLSPLLNDHSMDTISSNEAHNSTSNNHIKTNDNSLPESDIEMDSNILNNTNEIEMEPNQSKISEMTVDNTREKEFSPPQTNQSINDILDTPITKKVTSTPVKKSPINFKKRLLSKSFNRPATLRRSSRRAQRIYENLVGLDEEPSNRSFNDSLLSNLDISNSNVSPADQSSKKQILSQSLDSPAPLRRSSRRARRIYDSLVDFDDEPINKSIKMSPKNISKTVLNDTDLSFINPTPLIRGNRKKLSDKVAIAQIMRSGIESYKKENAIDSPTPNLGKIISIIENSGRRINTRKRNPSSESQTIANASRIIDSFSQAVIKKLFGSPNSKEAKEFFEEFVEFYPGESRGDLPKNKRGAKRMLRGVRRQNPENYIRGQVNDKKRRKTRDSAYGSLIPIVNNE